MIISVIDIGTNSVKLTIGKTRSHNFFDLIHESSAVTRIGRGMVKNGIISKEAMRKTIDVVKRFFLISQLYRTKKLIVVGTEALRKAKNSNYFLKNLELKTGLKCRILQSNDEARFSFLGARSLFKMKETVLIDIGGGSVEIVYARANRVLYSKSLRLGVVFLMESFLKNDPPAVEQIEDLRNHVKSALKGLKPCDLKNHKMVGVGGTINCIHSAIFRSKLKITSKQLEDFLLKTSRMATKQRIKRLGIPLGRADLVVAGSILLIELLKHYSRNELYVSHRGLRHGLIMSCIG